MIRQSSVRFLTALVLLVFCSSTAFAATITVNTDKGDWNTEDGLCSIREAFASANQDISFDTCATGDGADVINLPTNAVINLEYSCAGDATEDTAAAFEDDTTCDDLRLSDETIVNGNGATVRGEGKNYQFGSYRVLEIAYQDFDGGGAGATSESDIGCEALFNVTLNNFTIQDGHTYCYGGGIRNSHANLTLNSMKVVNNYLDNECPYGGGIYSTGPLTLNDSEVSDNTANYGYGGGIYIEHECKSDEYGLLALNINNSKVDNNCKYSEECREDHEDAAASCDTVNSCIAGGGIYAENVVANISNGSSISGNQATAHDYRYGSDVGGGGIYSEYSNFIITDTNVDNNAAGAMYYYGPGGGIRFLGHAENIDTGEEGPCDGDNDDDDDDDDNGFDFDFALVIKDSSVSGNDATEGGGLSVIGANLEVLSSLIDANAARNLAGGVYFQGTYDKCLEEIVNTFLLDKSTVSNNEANFTGGVYNIRGLFTGTNSTFSGNKAFTSGGGAYAQSFSGKGSVNIAQGSAEEVPELPEVELPESITLGVFNNVTVTNNSVDTDRPLELFPAATEGDTAEVGFDPCLLIARRVGHNAAEAGGILAGEDDVELNNTIVAGNFDGQFCVKDVEPQPEPSPSEDPTPNETMIPKFPGFIHFYGPDIAQGDCVEPDIKHFPAEDGETSNEYGFCFDFYPGHIVSNGYNLIGVSDSDSLEDWEPAVGDKVGFVEDPLDPDLGPLQDNGGSTPTHLPNLTSPAVDMANPAAVAALGVDAESNAPLPCKSDDQRTVVRPQTPVPGGEEICDIGAVELEGTNCTELNANPTQLSMDGGLDELQQLGRKAIKKARRKGAGRKRARRWSKQLASLYLAGWEATWLGLPANFLQCPDANVSQFCVSVSTSDATNSFIEQSDEMRSVIRKITRAIRKLGGRAKRVNRKADKLHGINVASAAAIPAAQLNCS